MFALKNLVCLLLLLGNIFSLSAIDDSFKEPVKISYTLSEDNLSQKVSVNLHFEVEKGWHIYWKNPGDVGMPINLDWQLPSEVKILNDNWSVPEVFSKNELQVIGYRDEAHILTEFSSNFQNAAININLLACNAESCLPISQQLVIDRADALNYGDVKGRFPQNIVITLAQRQNGLIELEIPKSSLQLADVDLKESMLDFVSASNDISVTNFKLDADKITLILTEKNPSKNVSGLLQISDDRGLSQVYSIDLPVDSSNNQLISYADEISTKSIDTSAEDFSGGIWAAIAFAFLGGMILNLMPCVLPVISLKILSFVKMSAQKKGESVKHGLFFSLGVLISFWTLALAIFILRAYGQVVGWGFQLQEPAFVAVLIAIFFLFALNLFGLFEWGLIFASWAGSRQSEAAKSVKGSYIGSLFSGVFATAVATPCTGPFLGSALGFALTLPALKSLLIFTALGIGMSFPYMILATFPTLLKFVPKPGAWMETFKQFTGFVLLAAVLWLLWVFSAQTNSISMMAILAALLLLAFGFWVYGKGAVPGASFSSKCTAYVTLVTALSLSFLVVKASSSMWHMQADFLSASTDDWEDFSAVKLADLKREGRPILIDFTAKWCLTCQVNHLVLDSESVAQNLNDLGVVKIKADWTKNDPEITAELSKFGRNSVPLYVLYKEGASEPVILPQLLTPETVNEHLNEMRKERDLIAEAEAK